MILDHLHGFSLTYYLESKNEPIQGLLVRKAAWEVLQAVAAGAYSDVALNRILLRKNFNKLDRGLITELSYGAIRQRYFLDCWIDFLGKVASSKQPPLLRWLLHIGLYQIFFMNKIPNGAIVHTTVELAKASKINKLSSVVNGILRSAIRAKEKGIGLPKSEKIEEKIAKNYSIPIWLSQDLISWEGESKAETIAKTFNIIPPIDIRVNKLISNRNDIRMTFQDNGINCKFIEGCPFGLEVEGSAGDVSNWPGFQEGRWCVQDRSSQWVSPLLEAKSNEIILDACCAPGGKTTHIAELVNDNAEIWAIDKSKKRLNKVIENSKRLNLKCLHFLHANACDLLKEKPDWKNYFHKILIDAPCSGLGTLSRNPDARWKISPLIIQELVIVQSQILDSLLPLLAKGGRIVYSTCTINPKENHDQISLFIKRHPQLKLMKQEQILPRLNNSGDGFYGAVIDWI